MFLFAALEVSQEAAHTRSAMWEPLFPAALWEPGIQACPELWVAIGDLEDPCIQTLKADDSVGSFDVACQFTIS